MDQSDLNHVERSSRIDRALDYLRSHRLHPVLEIILAWVVSFLCFVVYCYNWFCFRWNYSHSIISVPLMTYDPCINYDLDTLCHQVRLISDDIALVQAIRYDASLRRKVSRFVLEAPKDTPAAKVLLQRLERVWIDLLRLPEPLATRNTTPFSISLVVPAYRESIDVVMDTLRVAYDHCCHPERVQVIIVLDKSRLWELDDTKWGAVEIVAYTGSGGRGPCHNAGAERAQGQVLTFLHADTVIPPKWDSQVQSTLFDRATNSNNERSIVQACAFSFGHNLQRLGELQYPWGINAVWLLGNLRATLLKLPYGDHIISIPTAYFHYIGGFPNQPIMEDLDLMDLFRKRTKFLTQEGIRIIPPPTAKCSVRRWQRFGVCYVTAVNALLVYRYTHQGWSTQQVFDYYYTQPCNPKKNR